MDAKDSKMVRGEFAPQAHLTQHIRDVRLILGEAARAGASLPISAVHLKLLERAVSDGLKDLDYSGIIRVTEDASIGVKQPIP